MTTPLTALDNIAEVTTRKVEEKLPEYIIALQGYFRKQEDDFTTYLARNSKKLSKIKPLNIPKDTPIKNRPINKPLEAFVNGYDWYKQEEDLLSILKYINHNTVPFGIENAIALLNQQATMAGKPKKKNFFGRLFKYDIHDAVTYANTPQFAADAQAYVTSNYDKFEAGAKQISKNIDAHTSELIYKELYSGIEDLESIPKLAVRVGDVFDDCSQNRAIMIARTETLRSFNTSTIDSYKTAKIKQAQILTANDERTCDICMGLNGLIMSIDEARNSLPLHVMCRCTWIPLIGKPMLKEPDRATVQGIVEKNPSVSIARYYKIPKVPVINKLEQAIWKIEKNIKDRATEKCYVLDKNGKTLFSKSGGKNSIKFTQEEAKLFKDSIFIHNHPADSPFSTDDIATMLRTKMAEIRAVGKSHRYVMKLKDAEKYLNADKLRETIHSVKGGIYDKWRIPFREGKISAKAASDAFHNELWETTVKEFDGLIYTVKEIP